MSEVLITKADGTTEPFESRKLESSLKRAGTSEKVTDEIVSEISSWVKSGMTTKKIYQRAYKLLNKKEYKPVAAKYSLKKAVFDLGPSGFPFEDFIAEIYRALGYEAMTGVMLKGKCAEHEVDMHAKKGERICGAEVKFHNNPGIKTDLKVALYVYARFDDLLEAGVVTEGALITNTEFTTNAITYGDCVGLSMIGWKHPEKDNLYDLIGTTGLHPITCLTTLPESKKKRLIENKLVLCRDVKQNSSILETYGIKEAQIQEILSEINALCQPGAGV